MEIVPPEGAESPKLPPRPAPRGGATPPKPPVPPSAAARPASAPPGPPAPPEVTVSEESEIGPAEEGLPSTLPPPASPVAAFDLGNVLAGKYLIERVIGEGGLGVVAAAKHLQLQQRVAIKYLRPESLKSPTLVERFIREARLAASIRSEHVARIYDVAVHEAGTPYIVMEYLAGSDLRTLLQDGPIAIPDAVDYVLQACEALAEAHVAGIVHRDLKPDNFFLAFGPGGGTSIKLLDFGISKMMITHSDSGRPLTGDTEKFGTPAYMSPEQLQASATVDARADVWSLGVVLFECLTDRMPFPGTDFPQLCTSILTAAPKKLSEELPGAPPELDLVIARCLEKDREKRYGSVAELADALGPFGLEESVRRVEHIRAVIQGQTSRRQGPRRSLVDAVEGRAVTRPSSSGPMRGLTRDAATTTAPEVPAAKKTRGLLVGVALTTLALGVCGGVLMVRNAAHDAGAQVAAGPNGARPPVAAAAPQQPAAQPAADPQAQATATAPAAPPASATPPASAAPAGSSAAPVAAGKAAQPAASGGSSAAAPASSAKASSRPAKKTGPTAPAHKQQPGPGPSDSFDPSGVVNPFQ